MNFCEAQNTLGNSFLSFKHFHTEQGHEYIRVHWNRYVNLLTFIPQIDSSTRVLEIGASILSSHIRKTYNCPTTVIYHPLEPEWKERCNHFGINSFPLELMRQQLPFNNNSFDLILLNEVMEHFPLHPSFIISQIIQKLSQNGELLITVPNFATSEKRLKLLFGHNPQDFMDKKYIYYAHHREPVMEECCALIKQNGGVITYSKFFDLDDNPDLLLSMKRFLIHLYRRRFHPFLHLIIPSMRKYIVIRAKKDIKNIKDDDSCTPPLSISKEYENNY